MPNPDILTVNEDSNHVKPVGHSVRTEPVNPNASGPAELALFAMMDGVDGCTERIATTCLHFDKRDCVCGSNDQVDIATT
jgi:hypothetical protein